MRRCCGAPRRRPSSPAAPPPTRSSRRAEGCARAGAGGVGGSYPSTYRAYPGVPTAITGATIFDGEGGRIENGTIVLLNGRVQAVGGADTPIPDGATRVGRRRAAG
jgi:hypothetical protein